MDWKYVMCAAVAAVVFLLPMILRYLRNAWQGCLTPEEEAIYDAAVRDAENYYEGFGDFYDKPCLPAAELIRAARGHPSPKAETHLRSEGPKECSCWYVVQGIEERLERSLDSEAGPNVAPILPTS